MFKRVVNALEVIALVCAAAFMVGLFINPSESKAPATTANPQGAAVFSDSCATCHGSDGEGGFGPRLAGGRVVDAFPDEADQIAFVTEGQDGMPAFGGRLSPADIAAVVRYTREDLAAK